MRNHAFIVVGVAAVALAGCVSYPVYQPVPVARLTPEQSAALANRPIDQAERDRLAAANAQVAREDQLAAVAPSYSYAYPPTYPVYPSYSYGYYGAYPYYGGLYPFYPGVSLSFGFRGGYRGGYGHGGYRGGYHGGGGFRGHR